LSLTRRQLLAGAGAIPWLSRAGNAQSRRPNIVLIIADDLAAWMCGCYGNKEIRTPNIDVLARGGMRFSNSFVNTPICSASRATLFTGRLPRQHGIHDFLTSNPIANPPQGQAAPPESFSKEIMISDLLAQAGYQCGYTGKWHMGDDERPQHNFDYWHTVTGGREYQDPLMSRNGERVQEKGYLAEITTDSAAQFIEKRKSGVPFFLVASYLNPHVPYTGHPEKYYRMYQKTSFDTIGWEPAAPNALREAEYMKDPVANIRKAAASVTALDDQVGRLVKKLDESGLRDNTLIVFTGDNGFLLGRHGLWSKGHASNPTNMYEEVVQVPMIWNWMGHIPVAQVRSDFVEFCDVLPTMCDIAGVAPPVRNLPGRSYRRILFNEPFPKKEPWDDFAYAHFRNTEMGRDRRFKLVLRDDGAGANELYDLRSDAGERNNLYENRQFITVRKALEKELRAWRTRYSS
jgi:choline-sulfatase